MLNEKMPLYFVPREFSLGVDVKRLTTLEENKNDSLNGKLYYHYFNNEQVDFFYLFVL